jgi:hypothetical protein
MELGIEKIGDVKVLFDTSYWKFGLISKTCPNILTPGTPGGPSGPSQDENKIADVNAKNKMILFIFLFLQLYQKLFHYYY